jgi:hypothetical protein
MPDACVVPLCSVTAVLILCSNLLRTLNLLLEEATILFNRTKIDPTAPHIIDLSIQEIIKSSANGTESSFHHHF